MDRNEDLLIHIKKSNTLIHLNIKELWMYRDLFVLLLYRDFSSKYKQTILGPAWFVIQPLLTTLVFTVIFGNIAKIPTDGIPSPLFYLCGLLAWNYHSGIVQGTGNTFQTNMHLFGKVYFPRILIPFSVSFSQLIGWIFQFLTFLIIYGYFYWFTEVGSKIMPQPTLLLLPLFLIQIALIALGTGFWLSSLTAKYRDLQHLQSFIVQTWMYLTPIVYPLSQIPEQFQWLAILNPMTMIVENFKYIFFGSGVTNLTWTLVSILIALILFLSGWILFNKTEKSFIDSV